MKETKFPILSLKRRPVDSASNLSLIALFATLLNGGGKFVLALLVGRTLGPTVLGLTQNILSTASLASLFFPTTAGTAASKFVAQDIAQDKGVASSRGVVVHLGVRVLQSMLLLAAVVVLILSLTRQSTWEVSLVTVLLVLAISMQVFVRGIYFGTSQIRALFWGELFVNGSMLIGCLVLIAIHAQPIWLLVPLVVVIFIWVFLSFPFGRSDRPEKSRARTIDRFVLIGTWGTLASAGFLQASVLFATLAGGLAFSGQYSAAMTLATPMALITGSIASVLFPELSRRHGVDDSDAIARTIARNISVLTTISVGIFGVLALSANSIMTLFWGEKYSGAGWMLIVLTFAMAVSSVATPAVISITSHSNRGMLTSAISSTIGLILGLAVWGLGLWLGQKALIPIGYGAGALAIATIPYVIAWRKFHLPILKTTLTAGLAAIILLAASLALEFAPSLVWLSLVASSSFLVIWVLIRKQDVLFLFIAVKGFLTPRK